MDESSHQPSVKPQELIGSTVYIAILSLMTLCMGLSMAFVMPFSSAFALKEVGISAGAYGVMALLGALCAIGCTVGLGVIADSRGWRREGAVGSLIAGALAFLLMSATPTPMAVFLITVTLMAVFGAAPAQLLSLSRVLTQVWPKAAAHQAAAYVRASFSLAWTVGPPVGAYLLGQGGFPLVFRLAAVLCLFAAALALRFGGSACPDVQGASHQRSEPVAQVLLETRKLRGYFAAVVCFSICSNINLAALPLLQLDSQVGTKGVGYLFGGAAAMECALMLALAVPLGRVKAAPCLAIGSLFYAAYAAAIFTTSPDRTGVLLAAQALNAFATTIYMLVGIQAFQEAAPNNPGAITALYASALSVGAILHGPIFSFLFAAWGPGAPFLACVALNLLASIVLLLPTSRLASNPHIRLS
jgi:MFS transporter, SET family, sugar efflux transporter